MLTASLAIGVSGTSGSAPTGVSPSAARAPSPLVAAGATGVAYIEGSAPVDLATLAQVAPAREAPQGGQTWVVGLGQASQPTCRSARHGLRRAIADRRLATHRWQDALGYPHTRTAFRERTALGCAYLRWLKARWSERADSAYRVWVSLRDPREAIAHVFGIYASEALAVSWCESKFHVTAGVGKHQYLGIFQMGTSERATYGHGWTALEQARAAYRYFVASGRDWSPWSCRP